jgi:hypothetical protein
MFWIAAATHNKGRQGKGYVVIPFIHANVL